jgi:uncharacterized protein (DUF4415 family)
MSKELSKIYSVEDILKDVKAGKTLTDWARVDALTDEDITEAMRTDPDWAEFMDVDWSKATIVYPVKKAAISIRLDNDVITYFKKGGKGYQGRINAVLRHFMQEQLKKDEDKAG